MTLALDGVRAVDARRVHADQDAARPHGRCLDLAAFQDLGPAEPVEDDCLHLAFPWRARACCGAGAISILYRRPNGLPVRIFQQRTSRVRNTEAAAARLDSRDHDPVS